MIIEDSREYYAEMKLYNDVMGIGLAVWGNAGASQVFQAIDKALDNYNLHELSCIKEAFEMLPEAVQRDIMSDVKSVTTMDAIERLRENILTLIKTRKAQTA